MPNSKYEIKCWMWPISTILLIVSLFSKCVGMARDSYETIQNAVNIFIAWIGNYVAYPRDGANGFGDISKLLGNIRSSINYRWLSSKNILDIKLDKIWGLKSKNKNGFSNLESILKAFIKLMIHLFTYCLALCDLALDQKIQYLGVA